MGSFTSATKILNDDCQDNDVDISANITRNELLDHCRKNLNQLPTIIERTFKHRDFSNFDLNKGILQLGSISESKFEIKHLNR